MKEIKTKDDIISLYHPLKNLEKVVRYFTHLQNNKDSNKLLIYLTEALRNHYNQNLNDYFEYTTHDNDDLTSGEIRLRYKCKKFTYREIIISYHVDEYGNVIYKWDGFEDILFDFLNYFCIMTNQLGFSLPYIEAENFQRYRELAIYLEDGWRLKDKIEKLWFDKNIKSLTAKEFIKYLQDETNPPPNAMICEKGPDWNQLIFDSENLRINFAPFKRNKDVDKMGVRWLTYDVNLAEWESNILTCQRMTIFEDRVLEIANTAKKNMHTSLKMMEELFLENIKKNEKD